MRLFRYETAWDLKEDCSKIVQECWRLTNSHIHGKLDTCKHALVEWRKVIQEEKAGGKWKLIKQMASLQNGKMAD